VKLPFDILYFIFCVLRYIFWYRMLGKKPPPINHKKLVQEKLGMSNEEWKDYKRKWKEKQEIAWRSRKR